jgi:hypothetical protein
MSKMRRRSFVLSSGDIEGRGGGGFISVVCELRDTARATRTTPAINRMIGPNVTIATSRRMNKKVNGTAIISIVTPSIWKISYYIRMFQANRRFFNVRLI